MREFTDQELIRREKAEKLREMGLDPYGNRFDRTAFNQDIKDNPKSAVVVHIKPDNYNVYAVELFTDSVKFFINDTHTFTYPRIETERSGQFPFGNREYYLLLNMQLGGDWAGPVNEQDLPAEMHIDWVRFLQIKEK